jgi:hypothetical protein
MFTVAGQRDYEFLCFKLNQAHTTLSSRSTLGIRFKLRASKSLEQIGCNTVPLGLGLAAVVVAKAGNSYASKARNETTFAKGNVADKNHESDCIGYARVLTNREGF